MVLELKLSKVGNSVGVVLPKEALARLNVEAGDTVTLTDAPEGVSPQLPPAASNLPNRWLRRRATFAATVIHCENLRSR